MQRHALNGLSLYCQQVFISNTFALFKKCWYFVKVLGRQQSVAVAYKLRYDWTFVMQCSWKKEKNVFFLNLGCTKLRNINSECSTLSFCCHLHVTHAKDVTTWAILEMFPWWSKPKGHYKCTIDDGEACWSMIMAGKAFSFYFFVKKNWKECHTTTLATKMY